MAGYPTLPASASFNSTLIPQLWAPKAQIKFYERTILNQIANTSYEGMITKYGDTVTINRTPDISVSTYVEGEELTYELPAADTVDLVIDKGLKYAFRVPDISKKQSIIEFMDDWSDDGAKQMKITQETNIYADIYSDVAAANTGATAGAISGDINLGVAGTPIAFTTANAIDLIVERAGTVLDEQNIPDEERWMILPAWACARLKNSDLKDASLTGDGKSTIRTGLIGMIDRFKIFQSNVLYKTVGDLATSALFGHKSALTYASQLVINETLRAEKSFGELVRGLQVYGYKVEKPDAMGHLYIAKS
jgi:hypothetical protein